MLISYSEAAMMPALIRNAFAKDSSDLVAHILQHVKFPCVGCRAMYHAPFDQARAEFDYDKTFGPAKLRGQNSA